MGLGCISDRGGIPTDDVYNSKSYIVNNKETQ